MEKRFTITEASKKVGVSYRTIMRWEKLGYISKAKRDWRGWRVYFREDIQRIKKFNLRLHTDAGALRSELGKTVEGLGHPPASKLKGGVHGRQTQTLSLVQ